ncbi:MAG: T9SS type A sorting domain-containing protein [Ignavibacteria bacterium]
MRHLKLLVLAVAFLFAANTYSQWTYCNGSVNMTGLGTFPFISVVDANTVWVAGGTGGVPKVFRTVNGGTNFTNASGTLTGPEFYAIWAIDATTCLVGDGGAVGGAGGNAKIWRTSDAGVTWTTVLTTGGTVGFFNGIAGLNSNRNFAYTQSDAPTGGAQLWATTTNGGLTWTTGTTVVAGTTGGAGSVWCASNTVFGHGMSGTARVCFSTNAGSTFNQGTLSVAGTFTSGFACNDVGSTMIAITSTSLPNISRSTNSGSTWTTVAAATGLTGTGLCKWIQGTNACYITGAVGVNGIKRSIDGGATWTTMTNPGLTGWNDIAFTFLGGVVYGYAISGSDGSVIKVTDNTLTGVDPTNTTTPTQFALQQNYPNPFNPATVIKFSVPTDSKVTLKIYNSVGAELMTVTDKDYAAGNYIENVDMSSFSTGVYFYTLSAGNFKETKKMMLVK